MKPETLTSIFNNYDLKMQIEQTRVNNKPELKTDYTQNTLKV